MPIFIVDTFNPIVDPKDPVCYAVGVGDSILAALERYADIGWENEPATILSTAVWVRDEKGKVVATGHYHYPHSSVHETWPVLDVHCHRYGAMYRFKVIKKDDESQVLSVETYAVDRRLVTERKLGGNR